MVVEARERRAREGLRHDDGGGGVAAAHVGHPAARLEARLHAVERGDPLADQVHRVARTEEALASLVDPGVVLVPADADTGAPKGLLFPASVVRVGNFIYVTNLAIDLRLFDNPATPTLTNGTIDSPWASEVLVHTISRINAHLPPVPGLP
jgi:hypothetical protein